MRALLSKVLAGSMVAGAALVVAACGGDGDTTVNNMTVDAGTEAMDTGNDVTAIDAGDATDMNAMDTGNAADLNSAASTDAAGNMTNGM